MTMVLSRTKRVLAFCVAWLITGNALALSFQGELSDSGAPVLGPVDIEVSLFDAPSGGVLLEGPFVFSAVALEGGRFSLELDFDPGWFDGSPRWLEIAVANPPGGSALILAPRSLISATPVSNYAQSGSWYGLIDTPPDFSDGVDDDTMGTLFCGENQIARILGGDWTCDLDQFTDPATVWSLGGNSGTNSFTDYIGTSDGAELVLRTANTEAMRINGVQNVGIGTNSPAARLNVVMNQLGVGLLANKGPGADTSPTIFGVNEGHGAAGSFLANDPTSMSPALSVISSTQGGGIMAEATSPLAHSIHAVARSGNFAGVFESFDAPFGVPALYASGEAGNGAIYAVSTGIGDALQLENTGNGTAAYMRAQSTDTAVQIDNQFADGNALTLLNSGSFTAGCPQCTSTLFSYQGGSGFNAVFAGGGQQSGVFIEAAAGQPGLQVAGGTKNAVVKTASGSRSLYTEESAGVWFTDYGFGQLEGGVSHIEIEPVFAQTVNLNEPYHVFLQARSRNCSDLAVIETKVSEFVVEAVTNPQCEFSYRLVARRKGYEDTRLEPAPWADSKARPSRRVQPRPSLTDS